MEPVVPPRIKAIRSKSMGVVHFAFHHGHLVVELWMRARDRGLAVKCVDGTYWSEIERKGIFWHLERYVESGARERVVVTSADILHVESRADFGYNP